MKFLIVDDHPIMRLGVRQLIEAAWPGARVTEAMSVAEAVADVGTDPPQVIVLDLSLPDASGTEAPALMLRAARGVPILVLSLNADPAFAGRLLQMGVTGYLPKARAGDDLVTALRGLLAGERYVTDEMARHLDPALSGRAPASAPHELMSPQELRVMQLIGAGLSVAQIAETMRLSPKTVASYRVRVLAKGGWANNAELARYCQQHGLLADAP